MREILWVTIWWLTIEVIGLAALPLTLRLFRNLPDGGYAFSKALGLLLVSYGLWLLVSFGLLDNTRIAIAFILMLVMLASGYLWHRQREEMRRLLGENRRWILTCEVVFALFYLLYGFFRAYDPAITGTEKPMDFALLNGILASRRFPPHDPWLSGFAISYYYFGYLMMATLTKLSGVPSSISYNLSLALLFSLTVTGACSLVYDLIVGERPEERKKAVLYGLLGGAMVALIGNLEGLLELLHAGGLGSDAFWQWMDVKDLVAAPRGGNWYLTGHWWWWRASRLIHDVVLGADSEVIDEFPFFSFLLGDMHPHVMSLPYVLLSLGLALHLFREQKKFSFSYRAPLSLLLPLCVGALGFLNSWDLPTFSLIVVAGYAMGRYLTSGGKGRLTLKETLYFALSLGGLSLLFYLPFYVGFRSQAGGPQPVPVRTKLHQYLIIHGLFIFVGLSFLAAQLREYMADRRGFRELLGKDWVRFVLKVLIVVGLLLVTPWVLIRFGSLLAFLFLLRPVSGAYPTTATFLVVLLTVSFWLLWQNVRRLGPSRSSFFVLLLLVMAFLLTLAVEFVYIKDIFNTRMNTVFKFYYQAWVLFAIGAAFGVYYLVGRERAGLWRYLWLAGFGVLFGSSLIYPLFATYSKAGYFAGPITLDGLAYMRVSRPDDYAAIQWLKAHTRGDEVILEATGPEYSEYGRVSGQTGLATVLGWGGHELQWRGDYREPRQRERDIEAIYTSDDQLEVRALLDKYGVRYVYVGELERRKYDLPRSIEEGFERFMELIYREGNVSIYEYR